jgi:ubiquitin-conjugating enzyme E2 Z
MRLMKDVKQIIKFPLNENGIYYIHDDTNMMRGYALMIGPEETPYFGGNYLFEMNFPLDYPHSPPTVKYWTNGDQIRFNPNLYKCGKVCVSLLNTWRGDQWTSCQTISSVLLTICSLLCKDPLLNEPGVLKTHPDMQRYTEIIEYANLKIAVVAIVNKREGVYQPFFESFYPFILQNFTKNRAKMLAFAKEKRSKRTLVKTGFYNMSVDVDYDQLVRQLEKIEC